jgi:RimJ/RimL family protein N-acetyltransferase
MLRDITESDLPIFFEHQRDPEANRMAGFPSRERDVFMADCREKVLGDPKVRKKTILAEGCVAGNVVSWTQSNKRLVGYWLGRDYWGRGIATAALSEFLAYETTRPLYAYVTAHNIGSIRVLEKCGFERVDGLEKVLFRLDTRMPLRAATPR